MVYYNTYITNNLLTNLLKKAWKYLNTVENWFIYIAIFQTQQMSYFTYFIIKSKYRYNVNKNKIQFSLLNNSKNLSFI